MERMKWSLYGNKAALNCVKRKLNSCFNLRLGKELFIADGELIALLPHYDWRGFDWSVWTEEVWLFADRHNKGSEPLYCEWHYYEE